MRRVCRDDERVVYGYIKFLAIDVTAVDSICLLPRKCTHGARVVCAQVADGLFCGVC